MKRILILLFLLSLSLSACGRRNVEYARGYEDAREQFEGSGFDEGYRSGYEAAKEEFKYSGYDEGYRSGYDVARDEFEGSDYDSGYNDGYSTGFEEGLSSFGDVDKETEPSERDTRPVRRDIDLSIAFERITYSRTGMKLVDRFYTIDEFGNQTDLKTIQYTYDKNNNLVEQAFFYDGSEAPSEKRTWIYDAHGNLTQYSIGGSIVSEWENTYDSAGNCLMKRAIGGVGHKEYTYKNGLLFSTYESWDASWEYDSDYGTILVPGISYDYIEYDTVGRPVKELLYEDGEPPKSYSYTYSQIENCTFCYDLTGRLRTKVSERRDSSGRILSRDREEFDECSSLERMMKYEFTYDDSSFSIIERDENNSIQFITIYEISDASLILSETDYNACGEIVSCQRYTYDSNGYVTKVERRSQNDTIVSYGPERTFYEDGTVKDILLIPGVNYIRPSLFTSSMSFSDYMN